MPKRQDAAIAPDQIHRERRSRHRHSVLPRTLVKLVETSAPPKAFRQERDRMVNSASRPMKISTERLRTEDRVAHALNPPPRGP
jgi:hypothetical protein